MRLAFARIEAVTGAGAVTFVERNQDLLAGIARQLESAPAEGAGACTAPIDAAGRHAAAVAGIGTGRSAAAGAERLAAEAATVGPLSLVAAGTSVTNRDALRGLSDDLRQRLDTPWVIVLAAEIDGRPAFVAAASDEAVAAGVNAGELARAMARTAGGGRRRPARTGHGRRQGPGTNPRGPGRRDAPTWLRRWQRHESSSRAASRHGSARVHPGGRDKPAAPS